MIEAWKIGVRVSVLDSASVGLRAISNAFMRAEGDAGRLEKRIKSIKGQFIAGGLMVGAGVGMLAMFKKPLDEAKAFQTEALRFASLGFGDKVNAQAVQFAQGMKTVGTSTRENMALLSDAMAVFKDLDHAKFAAPIMAKMKFANEAMFGESGGGANERKFMDMLKVIEFRRGLNSPQEFATQADYVQKVIAGSRNRVDAGQMLQSLRAGGVALSQLSNKAFYLGLEPMIQEMGGFRVGTGSLALYNNLVQSRGSISSQQELYRLGLLDKSKVQFNSLGMVKRALPGAFIGSETLEKEGALATLNKVLLPAFRAHGITTDAQVLQELGRILSNSRGSTMISSLFQRRDQIAKMIDANQNAMGINATADAANKSLNGKQIDFHAKFANLMLTLGETVLPLACAALERLIPLVRGLTDWMNKHRTATKALALGFVGLGAAMMIGGTVLLTTAAFRGLGLALQFATLGGPAGIIRTAVSLGIFGKALLFSQVGGPGGILGIGKSLTSVTGALGLLSQAAALFMAGYAGWKAGGYIYDHALADNAGGRGIGSAVAHVAAFFGSDDAQNAINGPVNNHSGDFHGLPRKGQVVHVTHVHLDGKVIASTVTKHQANAARRPQTGTSAFDGSRIPAPVGVSGGW